MLLFKAIRGLRIVSRPSLPSPPPPSLVLRSKLATMANTTPDWQRVTSGTAPPFSVFTKPLQKSEQDDREYRIIQLDNGLQATLVYDAKADKAAASLDVAVGHLYDPVRFSLIRHVTRLKTRYLS